MDTNTMTKRLVCGVGINDLAEPVYKNGSNLKFYGTWKHMLERCYSGKFQIKEPSYIGCSVCPDWLVLSNFKEWYDINCRDGLALDKDILIQGNKVYSPVTCRFVPGYINSLMTDDGANRGKLPLGVSAIRPDPKIGRINTTYMARCCNGNGKQTTKNFKTVEGARQWYSTTKKRVANEQAVRAFESGDITEDVYQALITREW